jgi:hypothetical protein
MAFLGSRNNHQLGLQALIPMDFSRLLLIEEETWASEENQTRKHVRDCAIGLGQSTVAIERPRNLYG